jgi:hypothetical protein
MPLCFRWRVDRSAIVGLGLRSAHNDRYEDARTAVLTEAALANEVDRWVSFSRRKAFYAGRRRYHGTSFTYRTVLAAVADGVRAGLLEEERALPGSRGRQSRFRATPILANHVTMTNMTDRINAVAESINTMPEEHRDAILNVLLAKKAEREKFGNTKLLTPAMAAAANPGNKSVLARIAAMCARIGYDLEPDKLVDMRALDAAFAKSNTSMDDRFGIKTALAKLSLVR